MTEPGFILEAFECGPLQTIGYVFADSETREAVIIDTPMESLGPIVSYVNTRRLHVKCIVLTHGHFDHVGDVAAIAATLQAPVWIHADDAAMLRNPFGLFPGFPYQIQGMEAQRLINNGEMFRLGKQEFAILHIPGHSPGSVCLHSKDLGLLFAGDVLFNGSIGRTDLPGGNYDELLQAITEILMLLPPDTVVYPGHGPPTTIGAESAVNPFIREYLDHF